MKPTERKPPLPLGTPLKPLPGNTDKFKLIVMQLQTALYRLGYYQGPIDGVIAGDTKTALRAMQSDFKLKVTGTATPETLTIMGIEAK